MYFLKPEFACLRVIYKTARYIVDRNADIPNARAIQCTLIN